MIERVLALVIDFRTTADAEVLTRQIAGSRRTGLSLSVVHVDNGNDTPVELSPAQRSCGVRLIRIDHNGGYAAGLRRAIEQLWAHGERFDAYWLLNSDLQVDPDCLGKLVAVLRSHPGTAAVGPVVRRGQTGKLWGARGVVSPFWGITGMTGWSRANALPKWSYLPGCSLLVRSRAYHDVGGIPDRYGMFYEETHLCIQLQKRGWELRVEPSAVVRHDVHSSGDGVPAPYQAFYFIRNNLYFWSANFGVPWYVQFPRLLLFVVPQQIWPLRRAPSLAAALLRLRFVGMGLIDGFPFLKRRVTHFERRHFGLARERPLDSQQ